MDVAAGDGSGGGDGGDAGRSLAEAIDSIGDGAGGRSGGGAAASARQWRQRIQVAQLERDPPLRSSQSKSPLPTSIP